jgi:hypothetical protein
VSHRLIELRQAEIAKVKIGKNHTHRQETHTQIKGRIEKEKRGMRGERKISRKEQVGRI